MDFYFDAIFRLNFVVLILMFDLMGKEPIEIPRKWM